ncbi:MAG TPA: hypothetical protein ENH30_07745, partial [Nitrospirae bacterium]|nr:hypothetical protein [Nitrospirota bacterium]
ERDSGRIKPCGGGIPSSAFEEFGISDSAVIKKIDKLLLVSPSGRKNIMNLSGGMINIVSRRLFDEQLREMASQAGAELVKGEFRKIRDTGKDYVIGIRQKNGTSLEVRADYVIGCDGVHSMVRQAMGLSPVNYVYTYSEIIRDASADACEFWFSESHAERSYSWVFPGGEGCLVGTGLRSRSKARESFDEFLKRRGLKSNGAGRGYMIPEWKDGDLVKGRVLFAGDAAAHVMPLSYEGIYYSMKSAHLASTAIIEGNILLYIKLWHKRFKSRFRFMKRLESHFMQNNRTMEKMVSILANPAIQKAFLKLWLKKDSDKNALLSYIRFFGKYLN